MNIFWSASFVKFPWYYWTEFSQSWKDLMKTLQSHGNLQSLTDLINGANIGTHWDSREWLFWMFIMSKMNPLTNKGMLFWKHVKHTWKWMAESDSMKWNRVILRKIKNFWYWITNGFFTGWLLVPEQILWLHITLISLDVFLTFSIDFMGYTSKIHE